MTPLEAAHEMENKSNPRYGEKGSFRKLTLTIPQEYYETLVRESARRKIMRQPNQVLSALLREALELYIERLPQT